MAQLHETGIGRKFFDKTLPELVAAIASLSKNVDLLTVEVRKLDRGQ